MDRRNIYIGLSEYFSKIPFYSCYGQLHDYITNVRELGSGTYGTVTLEKILQGEYRETKVALKKSKYRTTLDLVREIYTLSACNIMVLNGICPNFPLTYKYGFCTSNMYEYNREYYYYFIQELFDRTLAEYEITNFPTLRSILVQGVMAILSLLSYLNLAHWDVRSDNTMIKPTKQSIISYRVNDKTYNVNNAGILFALIDFGFSADAGFSIYPKESDADFTTLLVTVHPSRARISGYSIDLLSLLKVVDLKISDKNNELKESKNYIRKWAESIITKPITSVTEFIKNIEQWLPPLTEKDTGIGSEIYTVYPPNSTVQKRLKKELLDIVTALEKNDRDVIPETLFYLYKLGRTSEADIDDARNKLADDYPEFTQFNNKRFDKYRKDTDKEKWINMPTAPDTVMPLDKINWLYVSSNTKLPESFFERNVTRLYWPGILNNRSIPLSFYEKHLDKISWYYLPYNSSVPLSFYEKHLDRINWCDLSKSRYVSLTFLENHLDRVDWKCLSENPSLPLSFVRTHLDKFDKDILFATYPELQTE